MAFGQPSGSTSISFPLADLTIEAFARIGFFAPQIQTIHMVEARRSLNLILQDWSGNRGVNLWKVELNYIPLTPGVASFPMPASTIQILDAYIRQYQISTTVTNIGNILVPLVNFVTGAPVVTQHGEPILISPGSGTLSSVQGSQTVTMTWHAHGQQVGDPISFTVQASIGGLVLLGTYVVNSVIDANNLTFQVDTPAGWTSTMQGSTPLFATTVSSPTVSVILPNHDLSVGDTFNVVVPVTLGGLTLSGNYTVTGVTTVYEFTFSAGINASSTAVAFENNSQIQFSGQQSGVVPIDLIMMPISRTEYASIPNKFSQARPTTFWLDRTNTPTLNIWQVAPTPQAGLPNNQPYAAGVYSMQQIDDANQVDGQTADLPLRWSPCLAAFLTASLAEKFKPELFQQKLAIAEATWSRVSVEDSENVPLYMIPTLSQYWT